MKKIVLGVLALSMALGGLGLGTVNTQAYGLASNFASCTSGQFALFGSCKFGWKGSGSCTSSAGYTGIYVDLRHNHPNSTTQEYFTLSSRWVGGGAGYSYVNSGQTRTAGGQYCMGFQMDTAGGGKRTTTYAFSRGY